MEQIAAAAGVSKGTLYDRYPTKEAVLEAVIADRVAQWSQNWEPHGEPLSANLEQRLKHRARKLIEYCCSEEVRYIERLFMSGPPLKQLLRMRYETGHRRTVQVIAQDIIEGTREQPVQPGVATRLAEMLVAMIYGWSRSNQEVRTVTREEAQAYADHAVEVLLRGRSAWGVSASRRRDGGR
jgi:AcrR family transcriptional regulator